MEQEETNAEEETEEQNGSEPNKYLPPVVHKTIGAPGTGKTTHVVGNPEIEDHQGLVEQNNAEFPLEDAQLIVTYTNAGVDEAADRLQVLTGLPRYKVDERVVTIHAQCYRSLDIDREVVQWYHKNDFCKKHDLEWTSQGDADDIMGEMDEGHSFYRIYGWLKSNRMDVSQWDECPAEFQSNRDFEKVAQEWEAYKNNPPEKYSEVGLIEFHDMIEQCIYWGRDILLERGIGYLFPSGDEEPKDVFLKARDSTVRDPSDLRGYGPFIDAKVLYVDEVQDLTPLQWEWYLMQKLVVEKVYIGGDDDQCLPPNAPVEVKNNPMFNPEDGHKEFQKPIKDVQVGDMVRTLTSDGEYSYRSVSNVKKKKVNEKTFRTIRTESGNLTAVTDNHKMLARVPDAEYETEVDKHYVYLMRDTDGMWRIGETDNLRQRLNVERGARCILPVASFDTREEALEKEMEWSLNYSIPQLTIEQRDGEVLSDPDVRERLYDAVNPQYGLVERDFNVFLDDPPLYKKSTTRGQTESVNINIKKCADMRGDSPRHSFNVQTSNEDMKDILREFDELTEVESGSGSTRFRTTSTDYTELGDLAKEVRDATGGDIITVMSPTEERSTATITPAGNLVEGMLVPVTRDGEVVWEEIVEIKDRTETTEVYDLTVPGTHTFTSSGIGVSNTIYGWAGANPNFMLDEEGDVTVLEKTYRIPRDIWEVCDGVIRQVDKRQEKDVEPHGEGGEFITMSRPNPQRIMHHLENEDHNCMVIFRANYMVDEFRKDLHTGGVPYRNMSTFDTWTEDIVNIRDALAKIDSGENKISSDELETLVEHAIRDCQHCRGNGCSHCDYDGEESMLAEYNGWSEDERVMGNFGGIKVERVRDMFSLLHDREFNSRNFLQECEALNYYEKDAIRGNLQQNNSHLYPDRVRIGTIHSAKGKEAETVVVATDSTQRIMSQMFEDVRDDPDKRINDPERRLYYVGMTRASKKLVLAEGVVNAETYISIRDLLSDEHWEGIQQGVDNNWDQTEDSYQARW